MTFVDFCPTLDDMIVSNRAVGKTGRIYDGLGALSTINNLMTIRGLMDELRPPRTLEIGLCYGGSALAFCAAHNKLGHKPDSQHVAIDPYQTTVWDSCGLMALERSGLNRYLDFRHGLSAVELPKLLGGGDKFGIIYVDGSHLFEDVFVDAYFGVRLLDENGIIALDDSSDPHVSKVLKFLRTNPALQEVDLSQYNKHSLRYRIGRMLGRVQLTAFRKVGPVERQWNAPFRNF